MKFQKPSALLGRFSNYLKSTKSVILKSKLVSRLSYKVALAFIIGATVLSWGITSAINNDISSATTNFNAIGTVSEVSANYIIIDNAKGSAQSSDGTYNLDLGYLTKVETNTYAPLNLSDIKIGDKIVVQGLTNGYTFFIKRIVSFTSTPTPITTNENATSTATTTESTATATNTSTTTEFVATTTTTTTTPSTPPATNTPKEELKATTTESVETTTTEYTSTTTEPTSPSTDDNATTTASTTPTIVETIKGAVGDAIDKVGEVIQSVVDKVTGGGAGTTTESVNPPIETVVPPAPETPSTSPNETL